MCRLLQMFSPACAWPWEFTGITKESPCLLRGSLHHTHTHTIMLSVWWAHVIACREPGAHTECWWGSLGGFFRKKGDTGERFLCAARKEDRQRGRDRETARERGRDREPRSSNVIYQSQTVPLPPGQYRARLPEHVATQSHVWMSVFFLSGTSLPSHLWKLQPTNRQTRHRPAPSHKPLFPHWPRFYICPD